MQAKRSRLCRGPQCGERISRRRGPLRSTARASNRSSSPPSGGDRRTRWSDLNACGQEGEHDGSCRLLDCRRSSRARPRHKLQPTWRQRYRRRRRSRHNRGQTDRSAARMVPTATVIGCLLNPNNPKTEWMRRGRRKKLRVCSGWNSKSSMLTTKPKSRGLSQLLRKGVPVDWSSSPTDFSSADPTRVRDGRGPDELRKQH